MSKISEIEEILEELKEEILELKDENLGLKDKVDELNDELQGWENHECDCNCEEEVREAIVENEKIPCNNLEDERKIKLLSANWEKFSYDQLYEMLNNLIPHMLPPRI